MVPPPLPPDPRDGGIVNVPDLPHAWSTPYLAVFDSVRVLIILSSLYLIYLLAFTIFLSRNKGQRALATSFLLAVMLSTWTQFERVGRPVSWRLAVAGLMATFGIYGIIQYMTGGHRMRDLTFKSWFVPPVPIPPKPMNVEQRLRDKYREERNTRIASAAVDAAERVADAVDEAARAVADDVEHAAKHAREEDAALDEDIARKDRNQS